MRQENGQSQLGAPGLIQVALALRPKGLFDFFAVQHPHIFMGAVSRRSPVVHYQGPDGATGGGLVDAYAEGKAGLIRPGFPIRA